MKFFRNLFSRKNVPSSPTPASEDEALSSPISPISPISTPPDNSKLNTQNSTFSDPPSPPDASSLFPDPDNKRNGKIARLPREIRDKINQCLFAGQSATSIARHLNQIPEVKAVLHTHFDGRPISQQNLSEWKLGGYRDWLLRQELLLKQRELAADAKELGQIAHNMADSLLGMLELEYTQLLKNRTNETPEEFEKKRKALSAQIQDLVKLRRCELQTRSVEVQEGRLEQDREKSAEEVHGKFMGWAQHPAIRRAFFLEPQARDAQMRAYHKLPPTPEDEALLKELSLRKRKKKQGTQTEHVPSQTEKTEPSPTAPVAPVSQPAVPPTSESAEHGNDQESADLSREAGCATNPPPSSLEGEASSSPISPISTPPDNSKLNTQNSTFSDHPSLPDVSRPAPDASSILDVPQLRDNTQHEPLLPPKMPPHPYHEAIRQGKSHEEAMAALFCGPAKRAERIREYEQYRKELAAYEAQVKTEPAVTRVFQPLLQSSTFSPNPQQPTYHSPLGEIHHPSDRWRVQTS